MFYRLMATEIRAVYLSADFEFLHPDGWQVPIDLSWLSCRPLSDFLLSHLVVKAFPFSITSFSTI